MWSSLVTKIKGWKTIIWARFLVLAGLAITALNMLTGDQVSAMLPERWRPFTPLVLVFIGMVSEILRWFTDGPVGSKADPLDPGKT